MMKDQEQQISRMLAGLKAVDAPEGFEGAVRTKIAEGRKDPSFIRPTIWLAAKFALPLVVLLLLGGFLMDSNGPSVNSALVPPVTDPPQSGSELEITQPSVSDVAATNDSAPRNSAATSDRNIRPSTDRPQGGSEDLALSPDNTTVYPTGIDPRRSPATNTKAPTGPSISSASVLLMIGISSDCSADGCLATGVREGSIAAAAGIHSGDLISAINGRPLNSGGISGQFSVSEISLIRDGKKMTISIARR